MKAKDKLDLNTKFNLSTNNDIIGGNSGSPLINARGNIVGLVFDGNIHSISGSFWFDDARNRTVAVHPAIMKEALDKVYGAKDLLAELQQPDT
jgi:V8-like Glu-specific endopeptidase